MWEYVSNASTKQIIDHIIPIVRDVSVTLLATLDGAQVVCKCVAYGNAKDRKRIIRSLKGKVVEACNHPSGYLTILSLMDLVDDTVMVQKMLMNELVPQLNDTALHPKGSKVLLQLLCPKSKKYLDERELKLLEPPMIPGENGELVLNFKKSPDVRRNELLKGLKAPIEKMLVENVVELLSSVSGSKVLIEAMTTWSSKALTDAIVTKLVWHNDQELYFQELAHFAIRKLILLNPNDFAIEFYTQIVSNFSSSIVDLAKSDRTGFVILALLKCSATSDKIKSDLVAAKDTLETFRTEQKSTRLILEILV